MNRYATIALLLACGGKGDVLRRENDALRARVHVLEAQNDNLRRQVRAAGRPRIPDERIELPRREQQTPGRFTLTIVSNGDTLVEGRVVSDADLASIARARDTEGTRAVISAERGVPYQRIVQIMDILRNNGIEDLSLAVQQTP